MPPQQNSITSVPENPQDPQPTQMPPLSSQFSVVESVPQMRKTSRGFIVAIVVVVVLIIAGVALAATGIVSVPFLSKNKGPYNKDHILVGIAQGFEKIQSFSYVSQIHILTKTPDKDVKPIESGFSIPTSPVDMTISLTGTNQYLDNDMNTSLSLSVDAVMQGFPLSLQAEFRKIKDEFFVQVSELPPILGNGFETLKGIWIKFSAKDVTSMTGNTSWEVDKKEVQDEYEKNVKLVTDQMKLFLSVADKDKIIVVKGNPVQETVEGTTTYRYDLALNPNSMVKFFQDAVTEFNAKYPDKRLSFTSADEQHLNSPQGKEMLAALSSGIKMSVWADGKGIPRKYSVEMRMLPKTKTSGGNVQQLNMDITVTLKDINTPVTIQTPINSISAEEAVTRLMGGGTLKQPAKTTQPKKITPRR